MANEFDVIPINLVHVSCPVEKPLWSLGDYQAAANFKSAKIAQ